MNQNSTTTTDPGKDWLNQLQDEYNKRQSAAQETMAPCPNCGYCPHCGRGGYGFRPWYPYPAPYYTPTWTTGTGGWVPTGTTTITSR